jgi:hypothetical protein
MGKILITGNGFDLFHHLPTKYGHFMAVMKTIEELNINQKFTFEDLFGEFFKTKFVEDFQNIKKYYETDNISFEFENIQVIKDNLKSNKWYNHFKQVLEIETWIDFEMEVSNILNQTSLIFETSQNLNNRHDFNIQKTGIYENFSVFDFLENSPGYIIIQKEFRDNRKGKINERKILKLLADSFNEFTLIFNDYLSDIVSCFYNKYQGKLYFPTERIDKIFSFNYTPTIESIYKKGNVTYLHGNIENKNIILGVNEIPEKVTENKGFEFLKSYQKIIKGSNFAINEHENRMEYHFIIFGHSLDFSDKEYISDLLNFVEERSFDDAKITIFFRDIKDKKNKLENLFYYEEEKKIIELERNKKIEFVEITEANILTQFLLTI